MNGASRPDERERSLREALFRRALIAIMVVATAGAVALIGILPASAQAQASATRSFNPATVAPGGTVTVTIQVANYGGIGRVTETLPAGFDYVSSTLTTRRESTV